MAIKLAIIGAASKSFGPAIIRDIFLSDVLCSQGVELSLMDIAGDNLKDIFEYTNLIMKKLNRSAKVSCTTELDIALKGAQFVICAAERRKFFYWTQDYHIPRKYGFKQVFGENGGPGGIFHALRNMCNVVPIAKAMEKQCPDALLLNFSNPEHKLCDAVSRFTHTKSIGLCHGFFIGLHQLSIILDIAVEHIEATACGMNHFTWFQKIIDRRNGEDLYPKLRERERLGDPLALWHELALGRILFRRFGLWPSPSTNHYGEYIRWADEFMATQMQFFYDAAHGAPWKCGFQPEWVYTIDCINTKRPWIPPAPTPDKTDNNELRPSGELAVPIIEAITADKTTKLEAVIVPNCGYIPNLEEGMAVEVPAVADGSGVHPCRMEPLPEAISALIRLQGSINKLTAEAWNERSKDKLLQAVLLDPCVDSYSRCIAMVNEFLEVQKDVLPDFGSN